MDTYSFLRELADSWVLLMMTLFFIGTIFWAFRPGSRTIHDDTAAIPFRNETTPPKRGPNCSHSCADCAGMRATDTPQEAAS